MSGPTIVWFRNDLSLADNPALRFACDCRAPVVPVYILCPDPDPARLHNWPMGAAARVWLHHSLIVLAEGIAAAGATLIIRQGEPGPVLQQLIRQTAATQLAWNRLYEPAVIKRDKALKAEFRRQGLQVKTFKAGLLREPFAVHNKQGQPFKVFTPFWRHCQALEAGPAPIAAPPPAVRKIIPLAGAVDSVPLEQLKLLPASGWQGGILASWRPGFKQAQRQLRRFLEDGLEGYPARRDFPGVDGVSGLSPYLHFGELTPRQVWHAIQARAGPSKAGQAYIRQLYWREFAHHLLYHFPHTPDAPLYEKYQRFPWRNDDKQLRAWQQGRTGYPIIDAGMRQLWHSGWMHNRVRMIAGSFLVKHLLLPWQQGAAWFWDTLVDADLANNTLGWQWVAGCGADAAPYFRIFNPLRQSQRFDPHGVYIRRWLPELARLDQRHIHSPWQAAAPALAAAGVKLGENYPYPLVDHAQAREQALAALAAV